MADRRAWALSLVLVTACDASLAATNDGGSAETDAAWDDPDPIVTDTERAILESLRYGTEPLEADPSNRVADDAAARLFGQRLFFETALAGPLLEGDHDGSRASLGLVGEAGRVSCASCHLPRSGFVDTRSNHQQISLGAQWTTRRSPTLLEVARMPLYNWDGRRDSLWSQAIGVMESDRELNSGRLFVAQQIHRLHRAEYEAIFGAMPPLDDGSQFPQLTGVEAGCLARTTMEGQVLDCRGKPGDGADYDAMSETAQAEVTEVTVNVAKAIAAYLRLLSCGESRFDRWLDGDEGALSRAEVRGAALFAGRAGCAECHSGPSLSDGAFHNVGLSPAPVAVAFTDLGDRGAAAAIPLLADDPLSTRGPWSDGPRDVWPEVDVAELEGAFRTPTLRCIARQPSFMHTGQLRSLEAVVAFFARGGDRAGYPGHSELRPLALSPREQADLVAFVGSLEGPGPDAALLEPLR